MKKKAIIFDLDNTIYSVHSIGEKLFKPLFKTIATSGEYKGEFEDIKDDIMRKPFQVVAAKYLFSDELSRKGLELLSTLVYEEEIEPFSDYIETRNLSIDKYLVTTGFPLLQQSKIRRMNLEKDFKEIHVVDPATSTKTKKDVFADIITRNGYDVTEVIVVGDDLHSEIKAAVELRIEAVLYDKDQSYKEPMIEYNFDGKLSQLPAIHHYKELARFI